MKKFYSDSFPLKANLIFLVRLKIILIFLTTFQLTLSAKSQSDLGYATIDNVIVTKPSQKHEENGKQQEKIKITGKITNSEGNPLAGVNIVEKGTTSGAVTDIDGNYSIEVSSPGAILSFSYIGFLPEEIKIEDGQSKIDIILIEDILSLESVVVTAIGTTIDADKTGSTRSVVSADDIVRSGESGIINSLAGKASGVKIGKANGDPGSGSSIQIRGSHTIEGASQPLIILDGIPISNDNLGQNVIISQQSRLNDLNAKDIKSIQVLKGASAAALWGSRAANGVIVITTKSGQLNQKPQIQYSYTQSFDFISVTEPLQDTYGQGRNGVWSPTFGESWGDKIADRSGTADDVDATGEYFISSTSDNIYYPITQKNSKATYQDSNWDQVFQTGHFQQHNFSIVGGTNNSTYFFSYERFDQEGIIRNFDYHRNNLRLNTKTQLYDWLSWSNKVTYTNVNSNRIIQAGETTNGIMLALLRCAPDFDITDYKGTYVDDNGNVFTSRHRFYRSQYGSQERPIYNNPLWTIYEQNAPNEVNRFIVNPELTIYPARWLKLIVRSGLDYYKDTRDQFYPIGSSSSKRYQGYWVKSDITSRELNFDGIAIANHYLSKDVTLTATLGVNYNDRNRFTNTNTLSGFNVESELLTSDLNPDQASTLWETEKMQIRSNRGFGILDFGIFDQVFVSLSGATEAASTIDGLFFYPSVDLAWQFTDLLHIEKNLLSFGKLRFSWGKVGTQPAPYKFYTLADVDFEAFGGSYIVDSEKGNRNLRPEVTSEWETGTNLRFLKDHINLGITYYSSKTKDILFAVKTNTSSGYIYNYKNAGTIENKGWEIDLSGKIIDTEGLVLSLKTNFNNNKNKVVDIAGAETVDIGGTSKAVKGYPMSSFFLPGSVRDADGNFVLDSTKNGGFPVLSSDYRVLGDPNPDWTGGLGLELKYKNFDFSFWFEHSHGGEYIDRTRVVLYGFGRHTDVANEITLTEDLWNYNNELVPAGTTVRGNIDDFGGGKVLLDESYYRSIGGGLGFSKLNDLFVEDATWTKLRSVTLGYTFSNIGITSRFNINSIRVSATGRDLVLWTKLVGVDPETNNYGVSNASGMNYFNNPGTRSILFNLECNF
jgi:TonB-linked SusC/RagA family outer membrane protein